MKFSIKDFFSKCDQIRSFQRILSHLLKKSLMENFVFCAVVFELNTGILFPLESSETIDFLMISGRIEISYSSLI